MTDRVESKRFDPRKVCTYLGRLLRSRRGLFSLVLELEKWMTLCRQRLSLSSLLECYPSFWDGALNWLGSSVCAESDDPEWRPSLRPLCGLRNGPLRYGGQQATC